MKRSNTIPIIFLPIYLFFSGLVVLFYGKPISFYFILFTVIFGIFLAINLLINMVRNLKNYSYEQNGIACTFLQFVKDFFKNFEFPDDYKIISFLYYSICILMLLFVAFGGLFIN